MGDVLQGECGIGGWWEIGEDTREPLEGRIQQDSINNLVFVPVKYEGKAALDDRIGKSLTNTPPIGNTSRGPRFSMHLIPDTRLLPVVNLQGSK